MRSLALATLLIAGVALLSLSCAEPAAPFTGLPFIHDDFDAAVAEAKQIGIRTPAYEQLAREYIARQAN